MDKKNKFDLYSGNDKSLDLISVIVPVYNVEKYLNRCIHSILKQTYKNFELILVNDGSTDNCGKICDEYSKKDNRIKVIHKDNGGLSDARNTGIESASGEYIMFVDSDDYISSKMVEILYKSIIENESDMALCNFTYVNEFGDELEDRNIKSPINNEILTSYDALYRLSASKGWYYVVAWNKLYKKELFDTIRFPYGKCHEDEFVAHKIFDKCRTISSVEDGLYFYVQRTDSIMSQNYSIKRLDVVEAYIDRALFFLEKGMDNLAVEVLSQAVSSLSAGYSRLDLALRENNSRYEILRKYIIDVYKKNKAVLLSDAKMKDKIKIVSFVLGMRLYKLLEKIVRH